MTALKVLSVVLKVCVLEDSVQVMAAAASDNPKVMVYWGMVSDLIIRRMLAAIYRQLRLCVEKCMV